MFIDRDQKEVLSDNMKETLAMEKRVLTLEKKVIIEEIKIDKKVTFREESQKKTAKNPFDLEGLQNFLKTMSNEMVELKNQVVEAYKGIILFNLNHPLKYLMKI